MIYYHVAEKWDGGDLESLYDREGDEAYDIFAERWPEAGGLSDLHVRLIHFHNTLSDAESHRRELGGEILQIELTEEEQEEVGLYIDDLEYSHPVATESIPAGNIKRLIAA